MDIEAIQTKVKNGKYIISFSHTEKIRQRKITAKEIEDAICEGTIIEPYPNDPRGASCLILGFTIDGSLYILFVVDWKRVKFLL
ncbi:MAG: DUF4258 domain-containing protein [Candidatus Brocadia sp.]|nr:DUF4258 domain-containing protein [Candidatus Brocadia sp.]